MAMMTSQKQIISTQDFKEILKEKQALVQKLIERCDRQQKKLTTMINEEGQNKAKRVPFSFFRDFIYKQKEVGPSFLCFRVKGESINGKQPIWISSNLQIVDSQTIIGQGQQNKDRINLVESKEQKEMGIQKIQSKTGEDIFKYEELLSKDVNKLKQNLDRCQKYIQSLKQLKQMEAIQKEQNLEYPSQKTLKIPKQHNSEDMQIQLYQVRTENRKLKDRVKQLEEAQDRYLQVIRELEGKLQGQHNKMEEKSMRSIGLNDVSRDKSRGKKSKRVLINY